MSKEITCPVCGSPVEEGSPFCGDCGAPLTVAQEEAVSVPDVPMPPKQEEELQVGNNANIMGDVNRSSTTNTNIQASTNITKSNTNTVNTSNVDNSSTVHNNTTIVMNGEKAAYCEVCGDPLGEKHARCPKCGKQICFDCKVKGKNRCVECEKKYVNEYRVAFQQLLLTTNGDIGLAGRQMMDQKARELDVEDVKASIENECMSFYKPRRQETARPAQPAEPVQEKKQASSGPAEKRINVPSSLVEGRTETRKDAPKGKSPVGIIVGAAVAVVIAVVLLLPRGEKPATQETAVEEVKEAAAPASRPAAPAEKPATAAPTPAPKAAKPAVPAAPKEDLDYKAGMAAYESGNGYDAVNAFTKSGSAESHYMLGLIYKNGCGSVGKNEMKAHKSFKKAASMGHEKAKAEI